MNVPDDYWQHAWNPGSPEYQEPLDDVEDMTLEALLALKSDLEAAAEDGDVSRRHRAAAELALREVKRRIATGDYIPDETEEDEDEA